MIHLRKTCSQCGKVYPATTEFFYARKDSKDGMFNICKICALDRQKIYYATERGKKVAKRAGKKYDASIHGRIARKKYRSTTNRILRDTYRQMIARCTKPHHKAWKNYGGRGIKICFTPDGFVNYIINVLHVDPRGLTIDRIDNDGNYEPGNIRFVKKSENNKNKRRR